MKTFPASQLIINEDGSAFHLHIRPEHLADKIILVGDQDRVTIVASYFDAGSIECDIQSREFHTITGKYKGKRISCVSTGIGTDNIDIVMNELDALANIDFTTRTEKQEKRQLEIVRIGTCGAMQDDIPLGSFLVSQKSIGFDGVLAFYKGRDEIADLGFEEALTAFIGYPAKAAVPYIVKADEELVERIAKDDMLRGCTIAANGFYGPQGRVLRCDIAVSDINERISAFRYEGQRITNYEMEGSAIAGLALLMGHKAMTVCCVIAQRKVEAANTDYKPRVKQLIQTVLERL
ncbi:MAG: nucleoside phosphorylase [Paludibacter sp.]|nr:nucleoside phosphorylase [Bacteroidales bacterium]MCM1068345.1 nucleoside phosphorylase [Prevotella sp.]MCM1354027.1 nucleoside phosphorylase [Bacteroides sp.]MCM1442131.1 nucleoside phosphorylase [Muribaculum sp.]MCM1481976.1 nucleoside phosphorylase [Paludibacter sp.]